jgi:ATP-dependent Clp protease, protease subunit
VAKVMIKGDIISNDEQWIYDLFEIEATSPKKVFAQIEQANGQDLDVEINSPGGSVFAGSEIYTALKEYSGYVTTKIVGLAASAASVAAMAGDKVVMTPTGQMMMHNASVRASGDYRDMDHTSMILKNVNQTIANAYKLKSGKSDEELLRMMDDETWFTPQQALENGLIDEIMFENKAPKIVASAEFSQRLPEQVINKIRNMKNLFNPADPSSVENQADILMREKLNAQIKLLKVKGCNTGE